MGSYIKRLVWKWLNKGKPNMVLVRYHESQTETIGLLFVDGEFVCYTLELPWRDNVRDISCIVEDTYEVTKHPTKDNKFRIQNVVGRSSIDIHIGNTHMDILGCVLLGTGVGKNDDCYYLTSSAKAMDRLKEIIGDRDAQLTITNIAHV